MAEEEIEYNVRINEQELSDQLERIRSQIDLTMGSMGASASELPQASDLVGSAGDLGGPNVASGLPQNVSAQMEQGFWDSMSSTLDQAAQQTQLGFSKFTEDMRRIGLLSQPQYPDMGMNALSNMPQQGPSGFMDTALALSLHSQSSFDPNQGGMNLTEFKREAASNFEDFFKGSTFRDNAGAAIGTSMGALLGMLGTSGGPAGAMTGLAIGGAMDLTAEVFASQTKERVAMADGIKEIAEESFGGIDTHRARRLAGILQDKAYSLEGRTQDQDMEALQTNLTGFADAGGFDNVSGPDEFEEVLRGVVDNTRQFANTMRVAQEDAVQIMAELQRNMIANTSEMDTIGADIGRTAEQFGLNPTDVLGFGIQGSEIVRGTGATGRQGFNMAMEARFQTERLRRADPTTRQLIAQAGGVEQFAIGRMESASRFMQSGQGSLVMTGLLGGMQGGPGSITDILTNSADYLTADRGNLFRFMSRQGELSASLGFENQQAMQVMTAYQFANQANFTDSNGEIDEDLLTGIMMQLQNVSAQDARSAIAGFHETARGSSVNSEAREALNTILSTAEEQNTTFLSRVSGSISEAFSLPESTTVGYMFSETIDDAVDMAESAGDWWEGQARFEGLEGVGAEDARAALRVTTSEEYRTALDRADNLSDEERRNLIQEDIKRYDRGINVRQKRRRLERRGINMEALDEALYGLEFEKGMDLMSTLDAWENRDMEPGEFQGLVELAQYNDAVSVDIEDRKASFNISDETLTTGTINDRLDASVSEATGGEITDFAEASASLQRAVADRLEAEGGLNETESKILSQLNVGFDRAETKTDSEMLERAGANLRSKLDNRISEELIPELNLDDAFVGNPEEDDETTQRKLMDAVRFAVENPEQDLRNGSTQYRFNLSRTAYEEVRRAANESSIAEELRSGYQRASGLETQAKARDGALRFFDEVMGEGYTELLSNPHLLEEQSRKILNRELTGKDITQSILSEEEIEKLEETRDPAEIKAALEANLNRELDANIGEISNKITREKFMQSLEENPDNLFKNHDEYIRNMVFGSLQGVIEPGGIKTIPGDKNDVRAPEDSIDHYRYYGS